MAQGISYYKVLGIPEALHGRSHLPAQTLRSAYRRALLRNHPDKAANSTTPREVYTVDQISAAFSVLSESKSRAAYDKELKLRPSATDAIGSNGAQVFRTGIEIVDLDDLETRDERTWYRSCRCGDELGFLIREEDLEEAAEEGEVSVGCRGCSLWLKVLFGVVEESAEHIAADERGT